MNPSVIAAVAIGLCLLALVPAGASRLRAEPPGGGGSGARVEVRRVAGALATGGAAWFAVSSLELLGVAIGVGAAAVSFVLLGQLDSAAQARRQLGLAAELPQVCDLLVACLEAGLPLRAGAEVVAGGLDGPMGKRLAEVVAKTRLGVAEERAWHELSVEPALAGLARELARGTSSGTTLAGRLRALGLDARREAFAAAEARAKKVGVQSVLPLMACFLPAFVLLGVLPIIGGLVLRMLPQ
jgi:pilus assembly protein TadC